MRKLKIILLHGPMCAGKGEQSKSLIRAYTKAGYKVASFDMGDRLREIKSDKTHHLSEVITPIMDDGDQIPLEIICQPWQEFFKKLDPDTEVIILSGVARLIDEVKIFIDYITGQMEVSEISIFRLNVTNEKTLERVKKRALEQKRTDDQSDASIMRRIEVYYGETTQSIDTFKQFSELKLIHKTSINFFEIDGNPGIQNVTYSILKNLSKKKSQITIGGENGSGKGTQVALLCHQLKFAPLSSGDFARSLSKLAGVSIEEASSSAKDNTKAVIVNFDTQIDNWVQSFSDKDKFIMDTRLGFHFLPDSFKVRFLLEPQTAAEWIWEDPIRREKEKNSNKISTKEEMSFLLQRRLDDDIERYQNQYNLDITNTSNYDLEIDVKQYKGRKEDLRDFVLNNFFTWLVSK